MADSETAAFKAGKEEGRLPTGFAGNCPFNRAEHLGELRDWMDGFGAGRVEAGISANPED